VTTVRHLARAVASTSTTTPAYRVDIRVGRHQLTADEPASAGGGDVAPSPVGLPLSALAACTATTLRMYATRKGWPLTTVEVDVRCNISDEGRGEIERTITIRGDLTNEQRQHLGDVAAHTPVTIAIRDGIPINTALTEP
jgi:putative redox protein